VGGSGADHRGSRRLSAAEARIWYVIAGASYIILSIWHKWLLNWFIGPAWLVGTVVVGPWIYDYLTGRRSSPSSEYRP
jgi:hypothetical protein